MIDIGANLADNVFCSDIDKTIVRAQQAGVQKIIVTGTSINESQKAASLAAKYPGTLYSTAGIHPHEAKHFNNHTLTQLKDIAQHKQVVALGEMGLDFYRNFSTPAEQIYAFEKQLELASQLNLPLFLHERDAHKTQWEMLKSYRNGFSNAVIHCFTGSREHAFHYLDLDFHIGITGWICDNKRGRDLQTLISSIPLHRLMIETDSPYLTPKVTPKPTLVSARRNEPCTLPLVVETMAKHSGHSYNSIIAETTKNAMRFFALKSA